MIKVLVTGSGSLLGQGIIKSIIDSDLKCKIVGADYFPSAVGLYWVNKGYLLPDFLKPEISEKQFIESIVKIINKEKIDFVLIGLDFEIPILAKHKIEIEKITKAKLIVSSNQIVRIGNDKWETVKYLKKNGFNYPESTLPDMVDDFLISNKFPLIVKPRFGHTSKNVFLVNNKKELFDSIIKCNKPIIQEYLSNSNSEYTCGSVFFDNKLISLVSLRRTLKNGNTYEAFSEKTNGIDKYIKKLTFSLKPLGPINFQLRIADRGPVVFEINPRFSGTTPIRAIFGINEVVILLKKLSGYNIDNEYEKKEGVVIRYYENQFIPWNQYKAFCK